MTKPLGPETPHRRLHEETQAPVELSLRDAINRVHALGHTKELNSINASLIEAERKLADLIDVIGDNGHHWQFSGDGEDYRVRCTRCNTIRLHGVDGEISQCTGVGKP